jgi:uncharacterized protein
VKFAADRMVGRLAKWLRALGYDTVYVRNMDEKNAARLMREGWIILTRNTRLVKRKAARNPVFVEHDRLEDQITQLAELGLIRFDKEKAFSRCMRCNEPLTLLPREEAADRVPEYIYNSQPHFFQCPRCGRIYWPGTHHDRMAELLETLPAPEDPPLRTNANSE